MDHNNILGTVLAGGKSQRFGEDKSQVTLANKLLIDYVLSEIIDQFKEILIVSNNSINFQSSEKITKIEDYKKGLGPLCGVLSAMKWIKANKRDYQWIATFPVDTPFFKKEKSSNANISFFGLHILASNQNFQCPKNPNPEAQNRQNYVEYVSSKSISI